MVMLDPSQLEVILCEEEDLAAPPPPLVLAISVEGERVWGWRVVLGLGPISKKLEEDDEAVCSRGCKCEKLCY
jgi:hypothetical protein